MTRTHAQASSCETFGKCLLCAFSIVYKVSNSYYLANEDVWNHEETSSIFSFSSQEFEVDVERQSVGDKNTAKEVPTLVLTVPNDKDSSSNSKFPAKDGKQFLPVRIFSMSVYVVRLFGRSYLQESSQPVLRTCFFFFLPAPVIQVSLYKMAWHWSHGSERKYVKITENQERYVC